MSVDCTFFSKTNFLGYSDYASLNKQKTNYLTHVDTEHNNYLSIPENIQIFSFWYPIFIKTASIPSSTPTYECELPILIKFVKLYKQHIRYM